MTREPTEMELRVARVLDPKAFGESDDSRLDTFYRNLRNAALEQARAAIRAMREPTPDMYDAGCTSFSENPADSYEAMIDAASPPDGSK